MVFARGLQALSLNEQQSSPIRAALRHATSQYFPRLPKEIDHELLQTAFKIEKTNEITIPTDEVFGGEISTYAADAKARNRPVLGEAAVRLTSQKNNYPNRTKGSSADKGEMKGKAHRYRCGSFERLARGCRLPFRWLPAFQ